MTPIIQQFINTLPDKRVSVAFTNIFNRALMPNAIDIAITAHAGGSQASARALNPTTSFHEVTTVATAADSVKLPPAVVGEMHFVKNSAASNAMQVYGDGTDTIDSVATGTGVSQLAGDATIYFCVVKGNYLRIAHKASTEVFDTVTINAIAGGDSSLGVDGQAAAQGGAIVLTGGTSSTATNAGGAVTLKGGTGNTTGAGGAANLLGGIAGATGIGGQVNVTGGVPTDAAGGAVVIAGAAGVGTNRAGGLASLTGGASTGNATGGVASLVGGAGSAATGVGGASLVTGGAGNTTGAGGVATVTAGVGGNDAVGGAASLIGGAAGGGNRAGGGAVITGGLGSGSAAGGAITVTSGAAGSTGVAGAVNIAVGAATSGNGSAVTITGGNGASGTNSGGNVNLVGGTAVSTGQPGEVQFNGDSNSLYATYFFTGASSAAPTTIYDQVFFIATRAMRVKTISQVHSVAAGSTSTLTIIKDTGTSSPGSGTSLHQSGSFNLNGTANTVQNATISTTITTVNLAAGDRLSVKFANAIQSSVGIVVTVGMVPI